MIQQTQNLVHHQHEAQHIVGVMIMINQYREYSIYINPWQSQTSPLKKVYHAIETTPF